MSLHQLPLSDALRTRKKLIAALLFCFILACADAPPKRFEWKTVVKGDWSAHLYDVHFVSENRGWAVGNFEPPRYGETEEAESLIIHTDDGGKNWHRQHSGIFGKPLRKVYFRDASKGWIVGDSGTLIRTTDGGGTWQRLETGTQNNLHDVFIGEDTGWVVGDWGTLLKSTDDGKTWTDVGESFLSQKRALRGIHFVDDTHGWLIAYSGGQKSGYVYATMNGGQTWTEQFATEQALFSLHFVDKLRGWVVGDRRSLFTTTDGGNTWEFVTDGSNKRHKENYGQPEYLGNEHLHTFSLYDVDFVQADVNANRATLHGWIVGDLGVILHTDGQKWKHQRGGPRFHNSADALLLGVDFISAQLGWAVGENGTILHTRNGGVTWEAQSSPSHLLVDVYAVSQDKGYVVGDRGAILQFGDGAVKGEWQAQDSRTTECFGATHFVSPQKGWAVAEAGVILHTTNGGSVWQRQPADTKQELLAVFFVDEETGWCVGSGGEIIHTDNGGKTWQPQRSGTNANLFDVHFSSKLRGWAVGILGTMLSTRDGGKQWHLDEGIARHKDTRYSQAWFDAVYFATDNVGWIVGIDGLILHTENGGKTWSRQEGHTQNNLDDVFFLSETEGWIVGKAGLVLHTKDGGENWRPQRTDTRTDLKAVHMSSAESGWVVGQYGTILTYTERKNE